MTTETIDVLLERDIDDLTAAAGRLRADERNTLLVSAAEALGRDLPHRLKLLRFVQALAAAPEPTLNHRAVETGAQALIAAAHAPDSTERLTALRALAVVASRAHELHVPVTHSMLATFEHARIDASPAVRDFANNILSTENPVFRQLISLEAATSYAR